MDKANTHIVIKREDALKYLTEVEYQTLEQLLYAIGKGRSNAGKKPTNNYYVCNTDEPYAQKVYNAIIDGEEEKKYAPYIVGITKIIDGNMDTINENWNALYKKADQFLSDLNIPYKVDRKKKYVAKRGPFRGPICNVTIPIKGNKVLLTELKANKCVYAQRESIEDGMRYAHFGIIMNKLI